MGVLVWLTALGGLASGQSPAPRVVVEYYHVDALGSVRAITNAQGQVVREADYEPFGEEVHRRPTRTPNTRRFTGKERDAETGLDYFGARYYRADVGRFTTVDPAMTIKENLLDPQRWNRYAYVRNNPLRYTIRMGETSFRFIFQWAAGSSRSSSSIRGSPSELRRLSRRSTTPEVQWDSRRSQN